MTIIEKIANKKQIDSKFWTVKKEILVFCVLAYTLSWGWWGMRFAPFWGQLISYGQPISRSQIGALDVQIGMFGPLIAAIVMRLWISRESFLFSLRLSRSWRAYLFAILMPTGLVIAAIIVNGVTGIGCFNWAGDSVLQVILNFVLIIPLAAVSAIGEEYGWRGYLLPRLLQGNEITASVVVGLIWSFWHLPLLVTGISFPGQPVTLAIPIFTFTIVMSSFLFTRLYWLSGGSFWTAALLHGILNALTELTSVKHYPDGDQLVVGVFGLTYAVILMTCVFAYYLIHKHGFVAQHQNSVI